MRKLILFILIPFFIACGNDSKKEKEDEEKGIADKLCNCLKEDVNNWNKFANGLRENGLVMDIIYTENLKCNEYWESPEYTAEIDEILDNSCPYSAKWAEIGLRWNECKECIAEKYY